MSRYAVLLQHCDGTRDIISCTGLHASSSGSPANHHVGGFINDYVRSDGEAKVGAARYSDLICSLGLPPFMRE